MRFGLCRPPFSPTIRCARHIVPPHTPESPASIASVMNRLSHSCIPSRFERHPAQGDEARTSARGRKTGLLMVVIADQRVRSAGQGRSLRVGSRTRLDDERGEACVASRVRVSARKQPRARQGPSLSHTRLPPSRIRSARAASDFPARSRVGGRLADTIRHDVGSARGARLLGQHAGWPRQQRL